jgi:hypothetical protein
MSVYAINDINQIRLFIMLYIYEGANLVFSDNQNRVSQAVLPNALEQQ